MYGNKSNSVSNYQQLQTHNSTALFDLSNVKNLEQSVNNSDLHKRAQKSGVEIKPPGSYALTIRLNFFPSPSFNKFKVNLITRRSAWGRSIKKKSVLGTLCHSFNPQLHSSMGVWCYKALSLHVAQLFVND